MGWEGDFEGKRECGTAGISSSLLYYQLQDSAGSSNPLESGASSKLLVVKAGLRLAICNHGCTPESL